MYGIWAVDSRGLDPASPPFDIPMQGLGVFACRKDAWLGFNPRFRGFGGEEWYIHEKFRRAGQRTLCLPFLRWAHRFNRTRKQAYDNRWGDRIYNYLTGFDELGLDTLSVVDYFAVDVSKRFAERARLAFERDRRNPFLFFGATYCINLDSAKNRWVEAGDRFKGLGIDRQVWRQSAVETPECHHLGCALSHWRIIERAAKSKLSSVLVLEDDVLFIQGAASMLEQCLEELDGVDWHYFYLGGHRWGQTFEKADGCHHIETLPVGTVTCTHAIVYHATVFDQLLSEIPDNENDMNDWIARWKGIDQFLMSKPNRFMACPVIASQPTLLDQEDDETRYKFY